MAISVVERTGGKIELIVQFFCWGDKTQSSCVLMSQDFLRILILRLRTEILLGEDDKNIIFLKIQEKNLKIEMEFTNLV